MEKNIKEAVGLAKWWLGLPPQKKIWAYLLGGVVIALFVVKILWKVIVSNIADNKADYEQCKEDNKQCRLENKDLQDKLQQTESDFRNYLIESNRRTEDMSRQTDSLIKVSQLKKPIK